MKRLYFLLLLIPSLLHAKSYLDYPDTDLSNFFTEADATYTIRYKHAYTRQIDVPTNCTIVFEGGWLQAPIRFNNTLLQGNVKLQGSHISGSLRNETFNAGWLCHADGKQDDAEAVNAIFAMSQRVHFPKGTYLLSSFHSPKYPINKPYHLGINHSHLTITGEDGATLLTQTKAGTLCIYSKPYAIDESISDIKIEGITFQVANEETEFDPYQEHCHTISFIGVNGATVKDCKFHNFWGDAICLNHYNDNEQTGERSRNQNVWVTGNYIDGYKHSNRNGISIINGKNVRVEANTIVHSSHKRMPGAIDIEANNTAYTIDSIQISNNIIDDSQGMNAAISVVSNNKKGPAHYIQITGNTITNSNRALAFWIDNQDCCHHVTITNNHADASTTPYIFWQSGTTHHWTFRNNTFECPSQQQFGGKVKIRKLTNKGNKIKILAWYEKGIMPIFISTGILFLVFLIFRYYQKKHL